VRVTGNPTKLVGELKDKIWQHSIARAQLDSYRERFQLISLRLFAGQTLVRVLSDTPPEPGFEAVPPDLEDLYFATIKGYVHRPDGTPVTQ
jgi:hypothetical protein